MYIELSLGAIAFITSVVAGVIGFAGGMMLIAIMPAFLHPALIIPIHGITQLASNGSRMVFSWQYVQWRLLPKFLWGSLAGVLLFAGLLLNMPSHYIPFFIGLYILLTLWSKRFSNIINRYENFYVIGFLQTGLGLVVGATGPIAVSVLTKNLGHPNQIIATSSLFMSISHLAKLFVFGWMGFAFFEHFFVILLMVIGAILGSWVGTKLRGFTKNESLVLLIKILLSVLATHMILAVMYS